MPKNEIKNTFTGGRMNKDLDERLITTGEYRDAMNVQVTTSEGSDVGSLHNILGNDKIGDITGSSGLGSIVRKATCIGSVADEKNDKLYWLIEGLSATSSSLDEEYYKADAIAEYDKLTNSIKPVVTDVYEVNVRINTAVNGHVAWTDAVGNPTVNQITISSGSLHYDGQTTMRKRIWKGMICTITDNCGGVLDEIDVFDFNDIDLGKVGTTSLGAVKNSILVKYDHDYGAKQNKSEATATDSTSQGTTVTGYNQTMKLEMDANEILDSTTASALASAYLEIMKDRHDTVDFSCVRPKYNHLEIGDIINFSNWPKELKIYGKTMGGSWDSITDTFSSVTTTWDSTAAGYFIVADISKTVTGCSIKAIKVS